ncbi:MAG: double zinc ribbon domain-containing protein [Tumebacillaceae bacterium]
MSQGDGYWNALLALLFPARPSCLLCRQPFVRGEEVVCGQCLAHVQAGRPPLCRVCGRELAQRGICTECNMRRECFFLRAVSYGPYHGQLRELLLRFKRERLVELLPLLTERLTEAWDAHLFDCGIDWLVPVPIAADKRRQRGFNQAEQLARQLSRQVAVPVCEPLQWQGESRSQAARGRQGRLLSMERSLALTSEASVVAGSTVCLVDDVYTTGATANACAKRLQEAGARTVYVLTVAR